MNRLGYILIFLMMACGIFTVAAMGTPKLKVSPSASDVAHWNKQLENSTSRYLNVKAAAEGMSKNWDTSVPLLKKYKEKRVLALADSLKAHQMEIADFLNRPLANINRDTLASLQAMLNLFNKDKALVALEKKAQTVSDLLRLRDKIGILMQLPYSQVEIVDVYQSLFKIDTKAITQGREVNAEMDRLRRYQNLWWNLQDLSKVFADSVAANDARYSPKGVNPGSKQKHEASEMLRNVLLSDSTLHADKLSDLPMILQMMQVLAKDAEANPLCLSENQKEVMAMLDLYAAIDIDEARRRAKNFPDTSDWGKIKAMRLANEETENNIRITNAGTEMYRTLIQGKPDWKKVQEAWAPLNGPYDLEQIENALHIAASLCADLDEADVKLIEQSLIEPLKGYGQGIEAFASVIDEVNGNKLVKYYRSSPGTSAEQQKASVAKVRDVVNVAAKSHSEDVQRLIATVPYLNTLWNEYIKYTPSAKDGALTVSPAETQILLLRTQIK